VTTMHYEFNLVKASGDVDRAKYHHAADSGEERHYSRGSTLRNSALRNCS